MTVALLAALVYVNLRSVEMAGWGDRLVVAPALAVLGMAVGLVAAKSPLRAPWAIIFALVIGGESAPLSQALLSQGVGWGEKLGWLSDSFWGGYRALVVQETAHDPLIFAVVVCYLGYLLGFCSSWLVFRLQNGWWALVLNASAGLVHLSYATVDSIPMFLASVFLGVLLVASLELHLRRTDWQAIGVPVQTGSTSWTLAVAGVLSGLALLLAARLPAGQINAELASRYQMLTDPWEDFQQRIDRLVGGGRGQARPGSGLAFGQSLRPRQDFELGTEPVLKISSPQRRYWRTSTYDRYDGRSIASSDTAERRYEAGLDLPRDPEGGRLRLTIEQKVTVLSPSASALFAAEAPISVTVPLVVDERQVAWDLGGLRPATALQRGQSYSVISAVPQPGRRELAESPARYPLWTERYLELPTSLPTRVGELANSLTATARTHLERALLIEGYLRGLTYSTRATVPPATRDWVDYLLFDSRSGYCDYFATAMAVMLRTQAIPARVASGFAPGVFDEQDKAWLVRESEAHSWTEVYFAGYGWLTFEPSAIRPIPERPESARLPRAESALSGGSATETDGQQDPGAGDLDGIPAERLSQPTPFGMGLISVAAALLLVSLGSGVLAFTWERGLRDQPPARRRYAQLRRWLSWGAMEQPAWLTPYELARKIRSRIPQLAEPVDRLVQRHVEVTYGPGPTAGSAEEAEAAWQRIRRPLAKAMLRGRLVKPDDKAYRDRE